MDLWSNQNLQSFMCITSHWLAETPSGLSFKSSIIAFHHVEGLHTGKNLAELVFRLLKRAKVIDRVRILNYDFSLN
jgi:hypothetical protein